MRVIIHAPVEQLILAARAAIYVQRPNYQWPTDGYALIDYEGTVMAVKRNKSSLTVWGQA